MTQDLFPEIQAAVKALENQITVTESEREDEGIDLRKKEACSRVAEGCRCGQPKGGQQEKESRTGSGFRVVLKSITHML